MRSWSIWMCMNHRTLWFLNMSTSMWMLACWWQILITEICHQFLDYVSNSQKYFFRHSSQRYLDFSLGSKKFETAQSESIIKNVTYEAVAHTYWNIGVLITLPISVRGRKIYDKLQTGHISPRKKANENFKIPGIHLKYANSPYHTRFNNCWQCGLDGFSNGSRNHCLSQSQLRVLNYLKILLSYKFYLMIFDGLFQNVLRRFNILDGVRYGS